MAVSLSLECVIPATLLLVEVRQEQVDLVMHFARRLIGA